MEKKGKDPKKGKDAKSSEESEGQKPELSEAKAVDKAKAVEGKMTRLGKLAVTQEGEPVLVTEDNKAFKTNPAVVAIWDLCGDRTEREVVDKVAEEANLPADEIGPAVSGVIAKLKELHLVR